MVEHYIQQGIEQEQNETQNKTVQDTVLGFFTRQSLSLTYPNLFLSLRGTTATC